MNYLIKISTALITVLLLALLSDQKTYVCHALDMTEEEALQSGIEYTIYKPRNYLIYPSNYVFPRYEIEITGCSEETTCLNIPDTIGGYPVREIEYEAFADNTNLKEVHIPDSVRRIGHDAFSNNLPSLIDGWLIRSDKTYIYYINDVTLEIKEGVKGISDRSDGDNYNSDAWYIKFPSTLKYIGARSFNNYEGLKSVSLPPGVEYVGFFAFHSCISLETVSIYNPDCIIYYSYNSGSQTFHPGIGMNISGYKDSTAEAYCIYSGGFKQLEKSQEIKQQHFSGYISDLKQMSEIILKNNTDDNKKFSDSDVNVFNLIRQKRRILNNN